MEEEEQLIFSRREIWSLAGFLGRVTVHAFYEASVRVYV